MREAAAAEEGAEAQEEAAPRGRGRGGQDHRSDNFFFCGGGCSSDCCCMLGIDRPARGFARAVFVPGAGEPLQRREGEGGEQRTQPERVELAKLRWSTEERGRRHCRGKRAGASTLGAMAPGYSAF